MEKPCYGLRSDIADRLISFGPNVPNYFEECAKLTAATYDALGLYISELFGDITEKVIGPFKPIRVPETWTVELVSAIESGDIKLKTAKELAEKALQGDIQPIPKSADISTATVAEVLSEYPEQAKNAAVGDEKSFNFLVGKILAKCKGTNAKQVVIALRGRMNNGP